MDPCSQNEPISILFNLKRRQRRSRCTDEEIAEARRLHAWMSARWLKMVPGGSGGYAAKVKVR